MKKTKLLSLGVAIGLALVVGAEGTQAKELKEKGNTYHVVEKGDTLSMIADKYDVSFEVVHGNNDKEIENADIIFAGQKLLVAGKDFDKDKVKEYVAPVVVVQAPVESVQSQDEYVQEYVEETTQPVVQSQAPAQSSYVASSSSAKEWIAMKESTNNYNATNGRYIGKYQLDASYLNGDHSPENQERVADAYVAGRYGSWENAQAFWLANGWY